MVGVHKIAPHREIEVKAVEVVAQPVGTMRAIYSHYDDAELFDESRVLVLDLGFFSVDWVVFNRSDIVIDSSDSALEAMKK
ncbi:hypothetical protein D3C76_912430 [compost metagenome]